MEARDRTRALALFAAALLAWLAVAAIVLTLDPRPDPGIRYLGAGAIGLAFALTTAPLFWLVTFARQRRIAYHGGWPTALRRGAWVGALVGIVVLLRTEGLFEPQIGLFLAALVVVAEVSLSARR